MKLTQTQLKKMILQEIKAVLTEEKESDRPDRITSVKKQGGISEKEVKIAEKILFIKNKTFLPYRKKIQNYANKRFSSSKTVVYYKNILS